MSKYNTATQGAVNKERVSQQNRVGHLEMLSASRLLPLDWSASLGIRRADIDVFVAAAVGFDHIVIVRATNVHSLKYVGQKGYVPKPIDCKP